MGQYLRSRLVWIGLGMLILGSGPLFLIIGAAAVGLWPDPNPNPNPESARDSGGR